MQELQLMPGARLLVDVFWQFVLEKLDQHANSKSKTFASELKILRSDVGDLLHVIYCPYVSIFCCDNAMRDRIRIAGWNTSHILTSDLELEAKLVELAPNR
jgi:hypothetical protein